MMKEKIIDFEEEKVKSFYDKYFDDFKLEMVYKAIPENNLLKHRYIIFISKDIKYYHKGYKGIEIRLNKKLSKDTIVAMPYSSYLINKNFHKKINYENEL